MLVTDVETRTPLFFAAAGKLLTYDPIAGSVTVLSKASPPLFLAKADDDSASINFSPTGRKSDYKFEVDFCSFIDATYRTSAECTAEESKLLCSGLSMSGSMTLTLTFDRNQPMPLRCVEIFPAPEGDQPVVRFINISANQPVRKRLQSFPSDAELSSCAEIEDSSSKKIATADVFRVLADGTRVVLARGALIDRSLRKNPLFEGVNWDEVSSRDAELGPALSKLLTTDVSTEGNSKD
jgi:hypothetical protein